MFLSFPAEGAIASCNVLVFVTDYSLHGQKWQKEPVCSVTVTVGFARTLFILLFHSFFSYI